MEIDPNTIVNALVAILGAGGVYGGGRLAYNRYTASRENAAQAEAGFSSMANTGQIQNPDLITGDECRDIRKGITDSIHEVKAEVKEGMKRQSGQLEKLSETVGEIKEALAGQEARVMKTVDRGVNKHERQLHAKAGT